VGNRGSREKRRRPREALASILFAGSMVWMMLCGGCQTMGRGGGYSISWSTSCKARGIREVADGELSIASPLPN
jgi:hypothetical protein